MSDEAWLEVNIDIFEKAMRRTRDGIRPFTLPPFFQYDNVPLRIFFLKPSGDPQEPYELLDWIGDACTVSLAGPSLTGGTGETAAASQTLTWNPTLSCFEGLLDLNTDVINDDMIDSDDYNERTGVDSKFEVKVVHASNGATMRYLQAALTLRASVNENATPPAVVGASYLTAAEIFELCALKVGRAGDRQRWVSDDGLKAREMVVENDGTWRMDPIDIAP